MTCSRYQAALHASLDGELPENAPEAVELAHHLHTCRACAAELSALTALRARTAELPRELPPSRDLWPDIARELAASNDPVERSADRPRRAVLPWLLPFATAAAIALLSTLAPSPSSPGAPSPVSWSVAPLAGAPRIAATPLAADGRLRVGEWLETDATSRAKLAVGSIGEVRVEPNSRLRLVGAAGNDHRVQLARGSLEALIWAPPRLFFVDTPTATAIDLGCAYTLKVEDDGATELHVTAGFVALAHGDIESIVPFGMKCRTRAGAGPGLPYPADVSTEVRAAVDAFDEASPASRSAALARLLALATEKEAVTLWHLLSRTSGDERATVYEKLAAMRPPPPGVTREAILAGDPTLRRMWGVELGLGPF
jgi:anti-sigma factor RsiW